MKTALPIILLLLALLVSCGKSGTTAYPWQLPANFPLPRIPEDNPMTNSKVQLGRHIFYDQRLSGNGHQSCASCHIQQHAFAEPLQHAIGSTGERHSRNTLSLTNVAYNETFTWAHAQLTQLEEQILIPLFNEQPVEMGVTFEEKKILQLFKQDATYQALFTQAFSAENDPVTFDNIVDALACFVRSLTSFNSAFDRYAYYGDDSALNDSQLRGLAIFMSEKTECRHCHGGFNFSQPVNHDSLQLIERPFHNTGLYFVEQVDPTFDQGLYNLSQQPEDKGLFRAPTLRNLIYTAPYMHDGSIASLDEVIQFYMDGGRNIEDGPYLGDGRKHPLKSQFVKPFELTEEEQLDLKNFLLSLSDESFVSNPAFANPWPGNTEAVISDSTN